ncbi:MAG: hypothetical protein PHY34_02020 [Patescibacteria group bacterium]|nr:hypothetical protein [Patescibacteria group bacterium]MDD5715289.1 hypothetical protein [Patescibacteria group bacterium]
MPNPEMSFDPMIESSNGEVEHTESVDDKIWASIESIQECSGEFNQDNAFHELSTSFDIDPTKSNCEIALEAHDRITDDNEGGFLSRFGKGKIAHLMKTFIVLAGLANFAGGRAVEPTQIESPQEKEKTEQVVDWDWDQVHQIFQDIVNTKVAATEQGALPGRIPETTEIDVAIKQLSTLARAFKANNKSVDEFHQAALNLTTHL